MSGVAAHYKISQCENGMDKLKSLFPTGEADSLNFVLFSTSGVHGSYLTIEEYADMSEDELEEHDGITFLIIMPRVVRLIYGNAKPASKDDFCFLKKLRKTSTTVMSKVGYQST